MGLGDVGIRAQRVWIPTTSCGHMYVCVAVSSFFIPFLHHVCAIGLYTHLGVPMHSHVSSARKPPSSSSSRCGRGASQSYSARVCSLMCVHCVFTTPSTHTKGAVKSWGPLHTSYNIIEELSDGCSRGGKYRGSSSMFRLLLPRRDFPTAEELCLALLDVMLKI